MCIRSADPIFLPSSCSWLFQDLDLTQWRVIRQGMLANPFGHMLTKSFHLDFTCNKVITCNKSHHYLIPVYTLHLVSKLSCDLRLVNFHDVTENLGQMRTMGQCPSCTLNYPVDFTYSSSLHTHNRPIYSWKNQTL